MDTTEVNVKNRIRNILLKHLKDQRDTGVVWSVVLLTAAFALGTFIGRLVFI